MKYSILFIFSVLFIGSAVAEEYVIEVTNIGKVNVSIGKDSTYGSTNQTTCLKFTGKGSEVCSEGWVAIPKNNPQLVSAVLAAKNGNLNVRPYFVVGSQELQCPSGPKTKCRLEDLTIY